MMIRRFATSLACCALTICIASAADWTQFRGPNSNGVSDDKGVPAKWSETENVLWKTKLPGLGTSSPITVGDAIFLTSYSGYAESIEAPGEMNNLMRHVVCLDRKTGKIRWTKDIKPQLPESQYRAGTDSWHGYASSTPTCDGERLYVFFGKSGLFCFDLTGQQLWTVDLGTKTTGWGSATSPILYENLVIVNAGVESGALVALDKKTGKEAWKVSGTSSAWSSPILVPVPGGKTELVMNLPGRPDGKIVGYDPSTGAELWRCTGIPDGYVCPSVISHEGVVYAIGGRKNTTVAVKTGGRGTVKPLWQASVGSNVTSPIYHEGHLYWLHESKGTAFCLDAKTGKQVYSERIRGAGRTYASATYADGKIFYLTQFEGMIVIAANPKFDILAQNKLDDKSRTNASPVIDNSRILIRTEKHLYCIGNK